MPIPMSTKICDSVSKIILFNLLPIDVAIIMLLLLLLLVLLLLVRLSIEIERIIAGRRGLPALVWLLLRGLILIKGVQLDLLLLKIELLLLVFGRWNEVLL